MRSKTTFNSFDIELNTDISSIMLKSVGIFDIELLMAVIFIISVLRILAYVIILRAMTDRVRNSDRKLKNPRYNLPPIFLGTIIVMMVCCSIYFMRGSAFHFGQLGFYREIGDVIIFWASCLPKTRFLQVKP